MAGGAAAGQELQGRVGRAAAGRGRVVEEAQAGQGDIVLGRDLGVADDRRLADAVGGVAAAVTDVPVLAPRIRTPTSMTRSSSNVPAATRIV